MEQPQVSDHQPKAASSGAAYEDTHVHAVYEAIAPHFSATRHKPWPRVASFLNAQPPGSVGLDVGCGNGKYLPVNPRLHLLGSDRSAALQDTLVPWVMKGPKGDPNEKGTTYQRYYHLYREGELEEDVLAAGGAVLEAGYERDNWWVVCSKQQQQPGDP
ncbi:unnamed protein product [Clonostachys rosea f. rosea IK726]|uniref:Uncharacterized protein n=1 Tax=Clonostachys rosea f. rosea IK726 TaxID=1349383 RepID=A0ACA9TDG4_BIOOC|nr:unnamed protein product [Clonostachys rosea f. rosea IK726]